MSKYTDAIRNTLIGYFNAGDQPTEAQFTELITKIQEGIEEHNHDGTGDGDGVASIGITAITGVGVTVPDDWYIGIGAALERIVFDAAGDVAVMGANLGVGTLTPTATVQLDVVANHTDGYAAYFFNDGNAANRYGLGIQCGQDAAGGTMYPVLFRDGDGDPNGNIIIVNGVVSFTNRSDASLKENICPTKKKGLDTILALQVKDFTWKASPGAKPVTGFVAQDVEKVMPEAAPELEGLKGVAMGMFMPMVVKSIQELDARLTQLGG